MTRAAKSKELYTVPPALPDDKDTAEAMLSDWEVKTAKGAWAWAAKTGYVLGDWDALAMPAAMLCDAKYMFSKNLHTALTNDDAWGPV